ncbi:hypothetical protein EDD41_2483 [Luteococcus japonicus]|uniref:Uncharacterized protein n=1 Tax=Luteococcus japonicus TaxID=33984 RepID=A0A3N1ZWK4_9ACTN|nr:hypothetical protein [Luteococcus japonicus]ROR55223.1 hypothetical protein EDD41_2483 [Luteococcus japonicus]
MALGRARILPVKRFEHRSALAQAPSVVLVGLLCGLVGLVHNRGMLAGLAWADRSRIPRELRGLRSGDAGLHGAAQ